MEAHLDSLRIMETRLDSNSQLDEQMKFLKTHITKETLKEVQERLIENEAFRLFSRTCSSKVEEMTRTLREYSEKNKVNADDVCAACCQDTIRIYVREFKRWNNLLRTNARTLARAQAIGNEQLSDQTNQLHKHVRDQIDSIVEQLPKPTLHSCLLNFGIPAQNSWDHALQKNLLKKFNALAGARGDSASVRYLQFRNLVEAIDKHRKRIPIDSGRCGFRDRANKAITRQVLEEENLPIPDWLRG